MIEAVIFDMDGVLVDTEPVHCASYRQVLADNGFPITEEEFYGHWTRNGKGIAEFIESRGWDLNADAIRREKRALYQQAIESNPPIIKGARETVMRLHQFYYQIGLATSSYRKETDLILSLIGLAGYFETTITCEDVKNAKPHPECFLQAGSQLGIPPKRTLVVEDAEKGVLAAKNAGMYVVAIPNKYTNGNDFSLADRILADIKNLTPEFISAIQ